MEYFQELTKTGKIEFLEYMRSHIEHEGHEPYETIEQAYMGLSSFHSRLFNEEYYIIGRYQSVQFIQREFGNCFKAIDIVKQYEKELFGHMYTEIDEESIANMLAYIIGEDIIYNVLGITHETTIQELLNNIEKALQ